MSTIKATAIFLMLVIVASCGPLLETLVVESRVDPLYPVNFDNKSISVFVSVTDSINGNDTIYLFKNDTSHMVRMAEGVATAIERNLAMDAGAIYVFKHYPDIDQEIDMGYIQNLSFISNSDIVVILDTMYVTYPDIFQNVGPSSGALYGSSFIFTSVRSVLNVYDGLTAQKLAEINKVDTVYWEVLSRRDLDYSSVLNRVRQSLPEVTAAIASEVVSTMFPAWEEQQRYLYVYETRTWERAYNHAFNFRWTEAMDIWMSETRNSDPQRVAAAAFNLAVACELTDRLDLAMEWIDLSLKSYNLKGALSYKQFLSEKLEKRER